MTSKKHGRLSGDELHVILEQIKSVDDLCEHCAIRDDDCDKCEYYEEEIDNCRLAEMFIERESIFKKSKILYNSLNDISIRDIYKRSIR